MRTGSIMVPESYIKKNDEIKAVRDLEEHLNRDVVDIIIKKIKESNRLEYENECRKHKNFASCTKWFNIFKNTYWGIFPIRGDRELPDSEIILNRNNFGNTMKSGRNRSDFEYDENYYEQRAYGMDHREEYIGKDGIKYQVCSQFPFNLILNEDQMKLEGWTKIDPLYQIGQDTYIREFDKDKIRCKQKLRKLYEEKKMYMKNDTYYVKKLKKTNKKIEELEESLGYVYERITKSF